MINRIRSMFTPPKQLDVDIDSSTPLQTPIKRESNITAPQQNTQSTSTATAELLTSAINTVISQTTKETEFKNLANLSQHAINKWLIEWRKYKLHSGLKAAISCINPGDLYRLAIRANITEDEFIAKYINDNDGFIKFLEEYRISTTLSVPQFFANKDLIMPPSEHFTQYSQFKIDEHISHFLEVIKTKASTLQQLGCTEKEIALALVNSLQPEIFKTAVSQQHGKTIAAVLENIDAVMVTFEIHQTIQTMSYPQKHKQNQKHHWQKLKIPLA